MSSSEDVAEAVKDWGEEYDLSEAIISSKKKYHFIGSGPITADSDTSKSEYWDRFQQKKTGANMLRGSTEFMGSFAGASYVTFVTYENLMDRMPSSLVRRPVLKLAAAMPILLSFGAVSGGISGVILAELLLGVRRFIARDEA